MIAFNCANGTIPVDLTALQDGESFEVQGTWVSRSGPITTSVRPVFPAHYEGTLLGNHLQLRVDLSQQTSTQTGDSVDSQVYDAYAEGSPAYDQACPL